MYSNRLDVVHAVAQRRVKRRLEEVSFVGLDAYEKAGGHVRCDLFSDDPNAGCIEDSELLHRLATDRLIELSQTVAAEGWAWAECRTRYDALEIMRHDRIQSHTRKPKKVEKGELAELTAKRGAAQNRPRWLL